MRTKKELSELLIKAIKSGRPEEQEQFINAYIKHCIDNNLFDVSADADDAKFRVEIIGQVIIIDSIHALNHTELMKADVIVKKVVDDVPKLMDAAVMLKAATKTKPKKPKKVIRGIKL